MYYQKGGSKSSQSYHPNRLVKKHDEYLTNKYLAKKLANTKSTISTFNQKYSEQLKRQRRKKAKT